MWNFYSIRYIKHNKTTSIFLAAISFLSSSLISLICGVFYNLWADKVSREILKNGSYTEKFEPSMIAYTFVLAVVCASLAAMIHNAFEVSMSSRLHQLGIFKSVGATPRQIRTFLLHEAAILCSVPIAAGVLSGAGLCYGFMQFIIRVTSPVREYAVIFRYHILIAVISFLLSMVTILISAWIPARRMGRILPLDAISYGGEIPVKKMKRFHGFSSVFGISGELARKSIYSRRKALRTSTVSLVLSFLALMSFLNLDTISGISTQRTYFDRFRDKWDLRLAAKEMQNQEQEMTGKIRRIEGVKNCVSYKIITASAKLSQNMFSNELKKTNFRENTEHFIKDEDGTYRSKAAVFVLDNKSFRKYCADNGLQAEKRAVAVNIIWDRVHSNRADRIYLPLLDTEQPVTLTIKNPKAPKKKNISVPIDSFTDTLPEIKEEFQQDSLNLVVSQDFYETIAKDFPYEKSFYNIKLTSEDKDSVVQRAIKKLLNPVSQYTLDSRKEQESSEGPMRKALRTVAGALAGLLSCIGIANVFSATLGQIYQRRKEFARYFSVGMPPGGMKKILLTEALIITLRPMILSAIVSVPVTAFALHFALIPVKDFIVQAPVIPILIFALFIFCFVSFAYYLGGKKILRAVIADELRDETVI